MTSHNHHPFRISLFLSAVGLFSLVTTTQAVPLLPTVNTNIILNITNWGASTTAVTNTTFIQNAINAASTTNGGAGATVEIPAGTFVSGPLNMANNVNLQIDTNAVLQMLPYASWNPLYGTTTFINCGDNKTNFSITGSGTIDGQAAFAGWWDGRDTSLRPYLVYVSKCKQMLFQDITVIRPPKMHFAIKNAGCGNITFLRVTINTDGAAPNTDGIDLTGTNCLVQDCTINAGDDNIAFGSSDGGVPSANITVTNCHFGTGHGVSIGSNTQGGVSNLTVIDCTFTNTDNAIRMKSDNGTGGSGYGGIAQNLYYYNITNHNIKYAPIIIYSYYNKYGNPTTAGISPTVAAATNAATITSYTPVWRNIVISNFFCDSTGQPGMIWARTEMPATNIILNNINITVTGSSGSGSFLLYHAKQVQVVDSSVSVSAVNYTFTLFDAQVVFTNSVPSDNGILLGGLTTSTYTSNPLAFYGVQATVLATNAIGTGPITLADSQVNINQNFKLFPSTVLNYVLDTNPDQVAVAGDLALGGTINVTTNASGFTAGTNTLLTYTGNLSGSPTLVTPGGPYTYSLDTSVDGQVNLLITMPTTSTIQPSANPSTYGTAVTFTATVNPAPTDGESVTFMDGLTTLGIGTLSSGQATYTTTATQLSAGSHSISAVYPGDGAYGASTSSPITQTVNTNALTVTGLTVNSKVYDGTTGGSLNTNGYALNTVISGDVVTLVTNGSTVTFASPNVANGINVTVSGLSLGGAQAGNYSLTQPTGLTGNIIPAGSSVALGASANPVAHLSSVAFTANMTPATLSGTVLFLTNGVAFDSQTLTGGTATSAATAVLPRGTNTITAQYSGNSNYSPSTNTLSEFVTNNPPTANPAVYYRLAGYPLTIVIADLATNWNDLDGDTMTLAGVSSPSTNGVVVAYDSADIYYTNANNVTDRFGYTISDGQGGTNNGTVTVLVAQQTVSSVAVNNGSVTLDFTGIPGSTYWVMAATNLVPPINWTPLSTNVVGTNGLWEFTDTQATNFIYRFYRTQSGQ